MPEIYVHVIEGKTPQQKRALMKSITDAVVRDFGVPVEAVVVEIIEARKSDKSKGGVVFSERG